MKVIRMGFYIGRDECIKRLIESFDNKEVGRSSHWEHYHKDFCVSDGKLRGMVGFGVLDIPPVGLRKFLHGILIQKFRKMGRKLPKFLEIDQAARQITARQNRHYNLDVLRQVLTLSWLRQEAEHCFLEDQFIVIIGDGFGTLASLLLETVPQVRICTVNLTKTLAADIEFLNLGCPDAEAALVTDQDGLLTVVGDKSKRLIALRAADHKLIQNLNVSVAFNIASMQEMDPPIIKEYFHDLRSTSGERVLFYCCNREEKQLPDGTIVRLQDYPWNEHDDVVHDSLCPWHQQYYSLRPPFYRNYDGRIRHRLVHLAQSR